jgi:hypothetical protein
MAVALYLFKSLSQHSSGTHTNFTTPRYIQLISENGNLHSKPTNEEVNHMRDATSTVFCSWYKATGLMHSFPVYIASHAALLLTSRIAPLFLQIWFLFLSISRQIWTTKCAVNNNRPVRSGILQSDRHLSHTFRRTFCLHHQNGRLRTTQLSFKTPLHTDK